MISPRRNNLGRKPHLWCKYGIWHCSNANAKGEGVSQKEAYRRWRSASFKWIARSIQRSQPPQPPVKNWP